MSKMLLNYIYSFSDLDSDYNPIIFSLSGQIGVTFYTLLFSGKNETQDKRIVINNIFLI